jgi:hypothetical protein
MRLFSVVIFVDNIAITCMVMKSLPQLGQLERAVLIVDMESIAWVSCTKWMETNSEYHSFCYVQEIHSFAVFHFHLSVKQMLCPSNVCNARQ